MELDPYSARLLAKEIERQRRGSWIYQVFRAVMFFVLAAAVVLLIALLNWL